jgi:flagellar biosynthetic protein FlhB
MSEQSSQDRTLPASPRKIRKARSEGQVARSRELGHFAALGAAGALFVATAPQVASSLRALVAEALSFDARSVADPGSMTEQVSLLTLELLWLVLPLGMLMMVAAVAAAVATGGWNFTMKALEPKFSKLNPVSGIGRMFSKQQFIDAMKASLLALILGGIGGFYLVSHVEGFMHTLAVTLPSGVAESAGVLYSGLALLVLALALFAAIDVPLQRQLHAGRLKMSHQEVKQENKESEGNQEVKARIRVRMREMSRQRMLTAVPGADLVIMNPTHYAVALKYDDATMAAPRVVAKGADLMALKIRDLARDAHVPVLQAPPLARALYAHAEIDREIPAALFSAVAQVLAHVYQLRAAMAGRGSMPGALPELIVPKELDPHHAKPGAADDGGEA